MHEFPGRLASLFCFLSFFCFLDEATLFLLLTCKHLWTFNCFALFSFFPPFFFSNASNICTVHVSSLCAVAEPDRRLFLKNMMMQLNRSVILECPHLDVPWFHEEYCQEQAKLLAGKGNMWAAVWWFCVRLFRSAKFLVTKVLAGKGRTWAAVWWFCVRVFKSAKFLVTKVLAGKGRTWAAVWWFCVHVFRSAKLLVTKVQFRREPQVNDFVLKFSGVLHCWSILFLLYSLGLNFCSYPAPP